MDSAPKGNPPQGNPPKGKPPKGKPKNVKKSKVQAARPCFVCRETGHWPAECPKAVCRNCGRSGHMASLCPEERDYGVKYRDAEELRSLELASEIRKRAREIASEDKLVRLFDGVEDKSAGLESTLRLPETPKHAPGETVHGAEPLDGPVAGDSLRVAGAPAGGGGPGPGGSGAKGPGGPDAPDGDGDGGGGGDGREVVVLRPPPPPVTPVAPARAPRVIKRSFRSPDDHELHDQRDIYISQVVDREPLDRRAAALKFAWSVLKMTVKGACVWGNVAAFAAGATSAWAAAHSYDRCLSGFSPVEVRATKQMMFDAAKVAGPVSDVAAHAMDEYANAMAKGGGEAFRTIDQVTGCNFQVGTFGHRAWTIGYMWLKAMQHHTPTILRALAIGAAVGAVVGAVWHGPDLLEGLKGRITQYNYLSASYAPSTTDLRPTSQKAREGFYQDALITTYNVVDSPAGWRGLLPEVFGYTVRREERVSMELFVSLTEPRIQVITDPDKLKQAISHRAGIEDRIYTDRYMYSVDMVAATTAAFAWHYIMSKIRGQPPVFW